jgi:hypothetical protein
LAIVSFLCEGRVEEEGRQYKREAVLLVIFHTEKIGISIRDVGRGVEAEEGLAFKG